MGLRIRNARAHTHTHTHTMMMMMMMAYIHSQLEVLSRRLYAHTSLRPISEIKLITPSSLLGRFHDLPAEADMPIKESRYEYLIRKTQTRELMRERERERERETRN